MCEYTCSQRLKNVAAKSCDANAQIILRQLSETHCSHMLSQKSHVLLPKQSVQRNPLKTFVPTCLSAPDAGKRSTTSAAKREPGPAAKALAKAASIGVKGYKKIGLSHGS